MSRKIGVLNLSRTPQRIGATAVPPARSNPAPVLVDLEDGAVRRDIKRFQDNIIVVAVPFNQRKAVVDLTAATTTAAGGVLAWQNPEGVRILVERVDLDVTTQSTGAASLDVGVAANGTTSADNLLDGVSVASAGHLSSVNDTDNGTNGVSKGKVAAAGEFVTATASATTAGMVGKAIITYTIIDD